MGKILISKKIPYLKKIHIFSIYSLCNNRHNNLEYKLKNNVQRLPFVGRFPTATHRHHRNETRNISCLFHFFFMTIT